jgi:hypothetical protein
VLSRLVFTGLAAFVISQLLIVGYENKSSSPEPQTIADEFGSNQKGFLKISDGK